MPSLLHRIALLLTAAPERVTALDFPSTDAALAAGIGPAASMAFPSALSVRWALDNVTPLPQEATA